MQVSRRSLSALSASLGLVFFVASCAEPSSVDTSTGSGGAGDTGTGGASTGTGGNGTGSGGVSAGTGGSTGTGGEVTGTGGKGTGGTGTGGATTGTGGASTGTGGAAGKAGGTGGTGIGTGGATGTGGTGTGTGGTKATGGTTGTGGTTATGGTTGTGGTTTTGTGGTTTTGGKSTVSGLPYPPGSTVAQPSGSPGNITVVNWAGYKGAVSYTLDDDNDSQISNYPTLHALGIPFTFYMWANRTEASNSVWVTAVKNGDEIGNHTWSHQSDGSVSDINMATTFIMQHLSVTPYTMAGPNGASDYTQLANGLFMTNRGVADAIVKPNDNSDRFTLPCFIPATGAPASSFNSEVDSAQSAGGWRIILVHGFTGDSSAYQPVNVSDYTSGIMHTISLGNMWIGRMVDVGAYWLGQKTVTSATTTTSGSNKTWTWTLPSNFAPGKYLRITVPGGTVTQKGVAVPWDSHGFYEISLDAGSVTVGP